MRHIAGHDDAEPLRLLSTSWRESFATPGGSLIRCNPRCCVPRSIKSAPACRFRGYRVSSSSASIHAALLANDSLILSDEAHWSEPVSPDVRGRAAATPKRPAWAEQGHHISTPFEFVELSATPRATNNPFRAE